VSVRVLGSFGRGLCCNVTFITQSPSEEQKADESKETNKGRESWVAVPFASGLSLREVFEDGEDGDEVTARVSERVIRRGRTMFEGREIECWLRSIKDSK
jgi:hypothetical protein